RRAVREIGDEQAIRLDAALSGQRSMRLLQHCARPYDDAIERSALELDRRHGERLLASVAQDRDAHVRLLNGALDLAEAIYDFTVDVENQIARTQDIVGRRSTDESSDAQHLTPF